MKIVDSHIEHLVISSIKGDISPAEQKELEGWMSLNDENALVYSRYKQAWAISEKAKMACLIDVECDWQKVKRKMFVRRNEFNSSRLLRVAAILASVLLVGVIGFLSVSTFITNRVEVVASNGTSTFYLPDSSYVVLNKGSKLSYDTDFMSSAREVTLAGEAFFCVRKAAGSSFEVALQNGRVKVMGTKFFVKENDSAHFEVKVETGRVLVSSGNKTVTLDKGEKALASASEIIKSEGFDGENLSWRSSRIVFKEATLVSVIEQIVQLYPEVDTYTLRTSDDTTKLTTSFENQSLIEVINELSIHFGKKMVVENRILVISD